MRSGTGESQYEKFIVDVKLKMYKFDEIKMLNFV